MKRNLIRLIFAVTIGLPLAMILRELLIRIDWLAQQSILCLAIAVWIATPLAFWLTNKTFGRPYIGQ